MDYFNYNNLDLVEYEKSSPKQIFLRMTEVGLTKFREMNFEKMLLVTWIKQWKL